jgi:hypothetical protein
MGYVKPSAKISVVYKNGVKDRISPGLLDTLLDAQQVDRFQRSEGWVRVGADRLRGKGGDYAGYERRRS